MSKPSPLEATEPLKHKRFLDYRRRLDQRRGRCHNRGAVGDVLQRRQSIRKRPNIAGWQVTSERVDSLLAALCIITIVMVSIECVRLFKREGSQFINKAPELTSGQTSKLFGEALSGYILNLILIGAVTLFYHSAGEYGFANKSPYYQPWFRLLDWILIVYAIIGLPYAFVTRAFRHNPQLDKKIYLHSPAEFSHIVSLRWP